MDDAEHLRRGGTIASRKSPTPQKRIEDRGFAGTHTAQHKYMKPGIGDFEYGHVILLPRLRLSQFIPRYLIASPTQERNQPPSSEKSLQVCNNIRFENMFKKIQSSRTSFCSPFFFLLKKIFSVDREEQYSFVHLFFSLSLKKFFAFYSW
jgi:hypothetical protein